MAGEIQWRNRQLSKIVSGKVVPDLGTSNLQEAPYLICTTCLSLRQALASPPCAHEQAVSHASVLFLHTSAQKQLRHTWPPLFGSGYGI